jgi:hypothetical protein
VTKASAWAQRLKEAESAKRCVERSAPTPFCLHLDSRQRIDLSIGTDGKPNLTFTDATNYRPEPDRLLAMAHWIIDMLGA